MSSIQLIAVQLYRRSLHVYFTTFDLILKYILQDTHVKLAPFPINPVKQYTKSKVGDICFFCYENFIAHSFLWELWEIFLLTYFLKMDFGAFWCIFFNIILSYKCSLLTYKIMIVQPGG